MNLCELKIDDNKLEIIYSDKKKRFYLGNELNINKYLEKLNITPSIIFVNLISVKNKFNLELELKKFIFEIKFYANLKNSNLNKFELNIKNSHRIKFKNIKFTFYNNIFNYIANKTENLNKLKNLNMENSEINLDLLSKTKNKTFENIIFKNCIIEGNFSKIKTKNLEIISSIFKNSKILILNKIENIILKKISNVNKIFIKKVGNLLISNNNLNYLFIKEIQNLKCINNKIEELKIKIAKNLEVIKNRFRYLFIENVYSVILYKNIYKFKYIESNKIYVNIEDLKHLYRFINIAKTKKIICILKNVNEIISLYLLLSYFNNTKIELKIEENYFESKNIIKNLIYESTDSKILLKDFVIKFNKLTSVYNNDNILLYQITFKFFIEKFFKLGINLPFIHNKILKKTLKI